MEYLYLFLIIVIAIVSANIITPVVMKAIIPPKPLPPMGPKPMIANILAEIDLLIELEIVAVVDVPMAVKEIPLIQDFKEVQKEVVFNVLQSLSTAFIAEVNKAGLKQAYLHSYVVRNTNAKLLDFIKQHNFTMK